MPEFTLAKAGARTTELCLIPCERNHSGLQVSSGVALHSRFASRLRALAFAGGCALEFLGVGNLGGHMKKLLLTITFTAMLAGLAAAQQVADLVQAGKIRVGVHSIMYTNDPRTGQLQAASTGIILLDIARTLGKQIGVEVSPVGHPTVPEMLTCVTSGACDVGFMGPDPSRSGVDFSAPILQLGYTFLVPAGSSIQRVADADRPEVRIAVVRDHASTLTLSRIFKHAQLVYAATPDPTFELLRTGQADAFASIRPVLLEYSSKLPGSRVVEDQYGANLLGMVVSKGQPARLAYIREFVEQAKASGLVHQAIERAALPGHQVVPARAN